MPADRSQRPYPYGAFDRQLSAGQAKYHLEQGEVRVDAVDSISDGVEEYYAGGAEARGTWIGSAGTSLGLAGPVDGDALRRVLAGLDPLDGTPLRASSSPVRVAGFDLTFSAPKSVSVLFGVGDRQCAPAAGPRRPNSALDLAPVGQPVLGVPLRSASAVDAEDVAGDRLQRPRLSGHIRDT